MSDDDSFMKTLDHTENNDCCDLIPPNAISDTDEQIVGNDQAIGVSFANVEDKGSFARGFWLRINLGTTLKRSLNVKESLNKRTFILMGG